MVRLQTISPLSPEELKNLHFSWNENQDQSDYDMEHLVQINENELENYYNAANEIYDMYVEAAEYVVENDLFFDLGIPFNLIDAIKKSWENDVHWHIYGRFNFSGGIDGKPIKLLGFEADAANLLYETAVIQTNLLNKNHIALEKHFNNSYEAITNNFKRLITLFDELDTFDQRYDGWKILFSSFADNEEDEVSTKFLQQMASEAGFETSFEFLEKTQFDENGIYDSNSNPYEYWFKFYPWEEIAHNEPELATTLTNIMNDQKAIIINPAYTLLFQSKGMMKILYDLFEDSPYLLETSFEPVENMQQIEKPVFGKNDSNAKLYDFNARVVDEIDGEYSNYKNIYQEYVDLPKDSEGFQYETSVLFAYEACGLGFQKKETRLSQTRRFVGHIID